MIPLPSLQREGLWQLQRTSRCDANIKGCGRREEKPTSCHLLPAVLACPGHRELAAGCRPPPRGPKVERKHRAGVAQSFFFFLSLSLSLCLSRGGLFLSFFLLNEKGEIAAEKAAVALLGAGEQEGALCLVLLGLARAGQELARAEEGFVDVVRRCVGLMSRDMALLQRAGDHGERFRAFLDSARELRWCKRILMPAWHWWPSPGTRVVAPEARSSGCKGCRFCIFNLWSAVLLQSFR